MNVTTRVVNAEFAQSKSAQDQMTLGRSRPGAAGAERSCNAPSREILVQRVESRAQVSLAGSQGGNQLAA